MKKFIGFCLLLTLILSLAMISVNAENVIAHKWDFTNGKENSGFSCSGNHSSTTFSSEGMDVILTGAKFPGSTTVEKVKVSETTLDGKKVYKIAKDYGSVTSSDISSKKVSFDDYKYLCIKARTDNPGDYLLKIYYDFTGDSIGFAESVVEYKTLSLTKDYKVYLVDLTSMANRFPGQDFSKMMFAIHTAVSEISNELKLYDVDADGVYDSADGDYYYSETPIQYSERKNMEIKEMYLANYDPNGVTIKLSASSNTITTEGGTVTLSTTLSSEAGITDSTVMFTSDDPDIAVVSNNGDGTATVVGVGNGKVKITAQSNQDKNATDSVEITVSGQRKKASSYEFRLLSIGNSYLRHQYHPNYSIWLPYGEEPRGMAASAYDKDYYARLQYYLTDGFTATMSAQRIANNSLEIAWKQGLANSSDTSDLSGWNKEISKQAILTAFEPYIEAFNTQNPNLITVQLGENLASANADVADLFYSTLYKAIADNKPEDCIVVAITVFADNEQSKAAKKYAVENGFYVADMSDISSYSVPNWYANPYLAYEQYIEYNELLGDGRADFRSHPGDLGMEEIAKRTYAQFKNAIPLEFTPEVVYLPEAITIIGPDSVTTQKIFSAKITPSDAVTDVVWSVSDESIATITSTGLLTPKHNGKVVITATSAFDSSVKAQKTITIKDQLETYTVTYNKGCLDEVTSMPEDDNYARGHFIVSDLVPVRKGYKFLGWTLNPTTPKTVYSISVSGNTTLYAVWEFADNWQFNTNDDFEGLSLGGFHQKVYLGEASVTSYQDGVSVFSSSLSLAEKLYKSFKVKLKVSSLEATNNLKLTITSTKGTYEYTKTIPNMDYNEYVFDISGVSGTITGFTLAPSIKDLTLTVDYVEFVRATDPTYITVPASSTVYFADGTVRVYSEETQLEVPAYAGYMVVNTNFNQSQTVYLVSDKGAVSLAPSLSDSLFNTGKTGIRSPSDATDERQGLRFLSTILDEAAALDKVVEFGYMVTVESKKMNFAEGYILNKELVDAGKAKIAVARSKEDNISIIYGHDVNQELTLFTTVVYGMPKTYEGYTTVIASRPYCKLSDGTYIYGEVLKKTLYEAAKAVKDAGGTDYANNKAYIDSIIETVEENKTGDTFTDVGGLLG